MCIEQGPLIGFFNFGNDLCHAVGPEKGRTLGALNFTHFFSHLGALVQQTQELLIERVNLYSQIGQSVCLNGLSHMCLSLSGFKVFEVRHQSLNPF